MDMVRISVKSVRK